MQPLEEPSGGEMSQIIEEELVNPITISVTDLSDRIIIFDEFADYSITSVNQKEAENKRDLVTGNISNLEFRDKNANYNSVNETEAPKYPHANDAESDLEGNGVNEIEADRESSGNETDSDLEENEV